jgi:hypothetical protein
MGRNQANVHSYLRSGTFNCTGQTGVQLIFKRWLTVEKSQFDTARILVNNVEVWRNSFTTHVLDTSWSTQSVDISAIADNNAAVVFSSSCSATADWNSAAGKIDALALGRIVRAPQCSAIQSFCAGDGSLATDCPCGNFGAAGHGCADALAPAGGLLVGRGSPAWTTCCCRPARCPDAALGVYLQQDGLNEVVFQNGVMCASGALIRLKVRAAVRRFQLVAGHHRPPAAFAMWLRHSRQRCPRYYSVWYRGAIPTFCSPAAANLTNGVMVTW